MFAQLNAWMHWGVEAHLDFTTQRKVLHTNIATALSLASLWFYAVLFAFIGNPALINVIYSQLPFYPMLLLVPYLNRLGLRCPARALLVFAVMGSQIAASLISFGSYLNSHYSYILFALGTIVIFPLERWRAIAVLFTANMALYLYFDFNWVPPAPVLLELDQDTVHMIRQLFPTTSLVTVLLLMSMVEIVAARGERKLEQLSVTDPLTGLPNRRYFESACKLEAAQNERGNGHLSLAILDIDHFKRVNDSYGHDVGDEVLVHIADLLRRSTRAGNVIARVGGEEFALLMPNTKAQEALEGAERIRANIEASPYNRKGKPLPLTISIGIAELARGATFEHAFKLADEALYAAKHKGRNRVEVHGDA